MRNFDQTHQNQHHLKASRRTLIDHADCTGARPVARSQWWRTDHLTTRPTRPSQRAFVPFEPPNRAGWQLLPPLIQGKKGGPDRSRHSNAPPTPPPSPPPPDMEAVKRLADNLVGLANPDAKGTARGMGQDLLVAVRKIYNAAQSQTGNVSLANLRKAVGEELKAAGIGTQGNRSWATVASQGTPLADTAHYSDKNKTIQAINQVSMKKGAIAARKLPSGDTIITFQSTTARDWHSTNTGWIKEAFGQQAEESKRTFAVLLKGVWKRDLQGTTEETFRREVGLQTVDKVKFRVPKRQETTRATVLVALTSQEEAQAYQFRPRTYKAAKDMSSNTFDFASRGEHDDGYQVVSRKRLRGRPTIAATAQHQALQDPLQTRISFGPGSLTTTTDAATTTPTIEGDANATNTTPTIEGNTSATTALCTRDGDDNTEGIKEALQVLLEEARYDLLAVQEPWVDRGTKSTYWPRSCKYHLVLELGGKAAIYISKQFDIGQRDFEAIEYWCRVWFPEIDLGQGGQGLELWSIYNALERKEDEFGRYETKAEDLLQPGSQWDLVIQTPKGTVTRALQGRQRARTSTIDHFWTSECFQTRFYGEECRGRVDHYPQVLEVGEGAGPRQAQPGGWAWKKMDRFRVEAEAKLLYKVIGLTDTGPDGLMARTRTTNGLDKAFDRLIGWLTWVVEESTPRKKGSCGYSSP
ncbi:hypothetical protein P885DRAFT_75874 [Corynascus similis CBS 632.67]